MDEDAKGAPDIARSIVPVSDPDGLTDWINEAVVNFLVPSTLTVNIARVDMPDGTVLAVNVPSSPELVALWDRQSHAIEFVRRQGKRKAYMNPIEAEQHRMNSARAVRLKLETLYGAGQRSNATLIDGLWINAQGQRLQRAAFKASQVQIASLGDDTFNLNVPLGNALKVVPIPYDAVEMAWIDGWDRISLLLKVRLVTEGSDLYVESR